MQLALSREDLVAMMQDSLGSIATEIGLRIEVKDLEEKVDRRCGPRYEHRPDRRLTRCGRHRGVLTLAGQKLPIQLRRVQRIDGQGEVDLETYDLLRRDEAMSHSGARSPRQRSSSRRASAKRAATCNSRKSTGRGSAPTIRSSESCARSGGGRAWWAPSRTARVP